MNRIDGRKFDQLRPVKLTPDFTKFAEGCCLIEIGNTVVLCTASVEDKVPPHVKQGAGSPRSIPCCPGPTASAAPGISPS